jgi:hypothetical protein
VGLLSRNIVFEGDAVDAAGAGAAAGHSPNPSPADNALTAGLGGVGRFSAVQTVRMGQRNVMARYPLHFHMLDAYDEQAPGVVVVDSDDATRVAASAGFSAVAATGSYAFRAHGAGYLHHRVGTSAPSGTQTVTFTVAVAATGVFDVLVTLPSEDCE